MVSKNCNWSGRWLCNLLYSRYPFSKAHYKMIAIHLSKHQTLDDDQKMIKEIDFTGHLDRDGDGDTIMFFTIEQSK